ncbi:uncharacterized protein LOC124688074 [Lolium rigidum]|uniref:uncharacterized protein LOC124688074 n=1 Tax=Lolium rigidum TaxID=89674 RepID=UPI001F5D7768|nr:uncharacterized protein LOC124688074 [Lolium rigidum]
MNGNGSNCPLRCARLHPLLCSDPRKRPRPLTSPPVAPHPPPLYKATPSFLIAYRTPPPIHAPRLPLWRANFFAGVPTAATTSRRILRLSATIFSRFSEDSGRHHHHLHARRSALGPGDFHLVDVSLRSCAQSQVSLMTSEND